MKLSAVILPALVGLANIPNQAMANEVDDSLGGWGPLFDMNVIPIHAMLLLDGQLLAYGTGIRGRQGAKVNYELWDTQTGRHELGRDHLLLTHNTSVNIFCSTLSMDVSNGNVVIFGGDDDANNGINDVTEFDSKTLEIHRHPAGNMHFARWYATSITLPDGRILVLGGKSGNLNGEESISIPEIWSPGGGLRVLPGAMIPEMGNWRDRQWYYPHAFINSQGDIIVILGHLRNQNVYRITVEGDGSATIVGKRIFQMDKLNPSIMYDVDKVVMLDSDGTLWDVDISDGNNIRFEAKLTLGRPRVSGVFSLLPDGRIIITGGNALAQQNGNNLPSAVYNVQIIDRSMNDKWTVYTGPDQELARLYHSSATILPDGTVFSGGGGSPGPFRNLNGQIYTPGYLYNSTTGGNATRPVIEDWPRRLRAGKTFVLTVDNTDVVAKVTATSPGSATHASNFEARFLNLEFEKIDAKTLLIVAVPNRNVFKPGVWLLNTVNHQGVPSIGRLTGVNVGPPRIQLVVHNGGTSCAQTRPGSEFVYLEECDEAQSWILLPQTKSSLRGNGVIASFRSRGDRSKCLYVSDRRMKLRPCNSNNPLQYLTLVGDYYDDSYNSTGIQLYRGTMDADCMQYFGPWANDTANLPIIMAPCNYRKSPWKVVFL